MTTKGTDNKRIHSQEGGTCMHMSDEQLTKAECVVGEWFWRGQKSKSKSNV